MRLVYFVNIESRFGQTMSLAIEKLGEMISSRRGTLGVRAAASEIGISPATLSRIENGHVPDLATFAAICRWLGEDPARFLGMQPSNSDAQPASVHLRKKKTLSIDTAVALGGMIVAVQQALRDRENL
ncbi:helix-turn-helix domain-containing protein [Agrobacterium tumefaciens]|uniref:helix-turn-helix domain-containing protein n=1 Tax=Agrobacterium tumefaciens TaxID=358 RepID=UPI001CBA6D19|nr:helix-turn-helix transcriptional regulator [Agrobacterium tumefaciens]